ncbi:unnamed protein product [Larinioides sclopetarius]|uniref:Uncharacterized protein n=1 Tax=Larinioides sclopetarius TaxID=280406 RepID=A0AAV2B5J1_9ARAC
MSIMLKDHGILIDRILSSGRNGEPPLSDMERSVAQSAHISACNKIKACLESGEIGIDDCDIDDAASFDKKITAFLVKFKRFVEYLKNSSRAKDNFLQRFHSFGQHCKATVIELREMAEELRDLKNKNDFTRLEANVYGAIYGCLFLTLPVCPAVGIVGGICGLMVNTASAIVTSGEIAVVKRKLNRAVELIEEEKKRYSAMQCFSCHEEEKEALDSFVSSSVLKQMAQKVENFRKITNKKDMTEDEFKNHYEDVLDYCMEKMAKESKLIEEYGKELAPAVMAFTFVVVLMNDHNRIALDYSLTTLRLKSAWNCGAIIGLAMGVFVFEVLLNKFLFV